MNARTEPNPTPVIRIGNAVANGAPAMLELFDAKPRDAGEPDFTGVFRGQPVVGIISTTQRNGDAMTPQLQIFNVGTGNVSRDVAVAVARPAVSWQESPAQDPWAHSFNDTLVFHLRKAGASDASYPWEHASGICTGAMSRKLHEELGFAKPMIARPANEIVERAPSGLGESLNLQSEERPAEAYRG